ncbi:hypothetical protein ES288_A10G177700v1 [Gossypium darwinii]|nr:hypothetical protein ES288_A10G177700v1 [Gossypium darwinii]
MTRGSHVRSHSSGALPVHSRSFLDCWNFSFLGSFRYNHPVCHCYLV